MDFLFFLKLDKKFQKWKNRKKWPFWSFLKNRKKGVFLITFLTTFCQLSYCSIRDLCQSGGSKNDPIFWLTYAHARATLAKATVGKKCMFFLNVLIVGVISKFDTKKVSKSSFFAFLRFFCQKFDTIRLGIGVQPLFGGPKMTQNGPFWRLTLSKPPLKNEGKLQKMVKKGDFWHSLKCPFLTHFWLIFETPTLKISRLKTTKMVENGQKVVKKRGHKMGQKGSFWPPGGQKGVKNWSFFGYP